ncbi:PAS domain S-box-containing protein [Tistlia consotensis]|uniref:histidine kinase n=1 Tax=Tistlia consotensis USBA 355 TaxID=560819 RepID=A0A1Y6CD16_9PROT|nr:PAS domain S-box-containing protein [Tistlia consotensis USBA 355]SNR45795.1 PAS domain S-box-containing protein [Tistlia consotensis]
MPFADLRLSTRLVLAMVALVLFAVLVAGLSAQRNLEQVIYPERLRRMATDAQELAGRLGTTVREARGDVLLLRQAPATRRLLDLLAAGVDGSGASSAGRHELGRLFRAVLEAKPAYLQVRLIDASGHEAVRTDRSGPGGTIRQVPRSELQVKGGRPYFAAALAVPQGEVYVSPIELNREHGAIEQPKAPVVRVAAPVEAEDGTPFGILVINVAMSPVFGAMREAAESAGLSLAVVDRQGDFLLHPDPSRSFAHEFGPAPRLQDELPSLDGLADLASVDPQFTARAETRDGAEIGVAAAAQDLGPGNRVAVVLTARRDRLLDSALEVLRTSALSGLAALLAAGLAVSVIAWRTLRPLGQITRAVKAVDRGEPVPLPAAAGEIGVLARAFEGHLERERLFSAAFAWANDAIMTTNSQGAITGWNRAAEALYGFAEAEAIGRPATIVVPEDRMAEFEEIQLRFRAGEPIAGLETVRQARDGRRLEVSLTLSPLRAADGRIIGASEIARDITARRAADARFRLAVEASPAAMLMTGEDGTILMVNSEAEAIFGYAADELVGQPVELLLPERFRSGHRRDRRLFLGDAGKRMMGVGRDLYARRKDGSEFPVEIGLNPLGTPEGTVVLSAIVDMTERKRDELALRLAKQEAERASEMKSQFLANMSHELRTPLNAIIGYSDLMLSGVAGAIEPAKYRSYLDDIKRGGTHLLSLINDLLDLSRAESGMISLEETSIDLVEIAESGVKLMAGDAQLKRLALTMTAEARSIRLRGDERMVTQILLNLLSNALKFTPAGGRVSVVVNRTFEGEPRLIVKDNGVGMPGSQIPRAFAAFVQVDDAYRREAQAGAGLGLALTKRFVELHRGRISLESQEKVGTEVTVVFPAERCLPAKVRPNERGDGKERRSSEQ